MRFYFCFITPKTRAGSDKYHPNFPLKVFAVSFIMLNIKNKCGKKSFFLSQSAGRVRQCLHLSLQFDLCDAVRPEQRIHSDPG